MIAKHVPIRSLGKSDFAGLVKYITDEQAKEHRIGAIQLTNCEAYSVRDAITEVLATQQANTRAEGDKTYHLLVSFRAGEQPDAATLKAIEDRICAGLGLGEHQRVSAVHHDTDNLHIHIAINKIHPTRHVIHEPYYPHRTLAELCEVLERAYGLQHDNHEPRRRGAETRAADMERHSGIESLVGWIKRECLDEIRGAQNWAELHQVMRDNGLEIRAGGNGLVVVAGDGTHVKASTLGREFSKAKLESRYGPFEALLEHRKQTRPQRQYQKAPMRLRADTAELYARYKTEQQSLTAARTEAIAQQRRQKERQIEEAKRKGQARRAAIKLMGGGRLTKKLLYSQASHALKSDLDAIHQQHQAACHCIYAQHSRRSWADWLKHRAMQGDGEALAALRAREAAQGLKGSTIQAQGVARPGHARVIDNITKKGTIIYRAGSSAVRDDGDRLQVSRDTAQEGVQQALRLAVERYGDRITVKGTAEFKARVIRAAVDLRLPITFDDSVLERLRQQHMTAGADARPSKTAARKPGVGQVGQKPPPQNRNRPRTLSQLGALPVNRSAQMTVGNAVKPPAAGDQERRRAELMAQRQVSQFRAAANRRKARANGYGDEGKVWRGLSADQRQRIERFNSQPVERQEIALARMGREAAARYDHEPQPPEWMPGRKSRTR